ncbi:MAG TPA: type II toxin-antitoxin system Phd/YefM family antitoxin, partial [Variovorax sp.]|nr:type II toxin-antitoxin system Phd/YefM family antitoxin [Variovorax sp.]
MDASSMNTWPVQDAKARFSEFLEACISEGPQMVTKRGAEAAVLVPVEEWRRL